MNREKSDAIESLRFMRFPRSGRNIKQPGCECILDIPGKQTGDDAEIKSETGFNYRQNSSLRDSRAAEFDKYRVAAIERDTVNAFQYERVGYGRETGKNQKNNRREPNSSIESRDQEGDGG
jgi:hypothetical protein